MSAKPTLEYARQCAKKLNLTPEQMKEAGLPSPEEMDTGKKPSKFRNRPVTDLRLNRKWDSEGEQRYGYRLAMLEDAGEIADLRFQVRVQLHIGKRYMKIDFAYFDNHLAIPVHDDFKPPNWKKLFPAWNLKRDIWVAGFGPGLLRVTSERKSAASGYFHEDFYPKPHPDTMNRLIAAFGPDVVADAIEAYRAAQDGESG